MKKLFLLFALSSLHFAAPAQNLLISLLPDSSHWRYFDLSTGAQLSVSGNVNYYDDQDLRTSSLTSSLWTGSPATYYRDTAIYDASGRLVLNISYRSLTSPEGPWEYWIMDSLEYDAQDRLIHTLGHYGSNDQWIPYYNIFYGFDDVNHVDSLLYLLWDATSQEWENYNRESSYHTADGRLLEFHRQNWEEDFAAWEDERNEYYTYLPDGHLQVLHSNEISSNDIETIRVDSSVYSPAGLLDSSFVRLIIEDFNINNLFVTDYNYNASSQLISSTTVRSQDNGITFVPNSRQFFAPGDGYYSNDYSFESQEIAEAGGYVPNWEQTYAFTPLGNGRVLLVDSYRGASPSDQLVQSTLDSTWYHAPGSLGVPTGFSGPAVELRFANPFHAGNTVVCNSSNTDALLTFRLCDMSGRLVGVGQAMPGDTWRPFFRLSEGVYWLGVWQNGQYLGGRKMVWKD